MQNFNTIRRFWTFERCWMRSRAPLGSLALHGMLFGGLLLLRPAADTAPTVAPGIMVVDLVLFDPSANGTGGQVPDADAVAEEPEPAAGAGERPTRDELEPELPTEVAPLEPVELPVDTIEPEPALAESGTPPDDALEATAGAEPVAVTQEPEPVVPDEPASRTVEPLPLAPTSPADAELIAAEPDAELPPLPEPRVPAVAALAASEREMLDARFAALSEHFADIAADDLVWEHDGRQYAASVTRVNAEDSMGIENVLVSVTTEHEGSRWATKMRMKRLAFSSFAQFVDRWDRNVQIHDDVIDGRFHSNSEIFISRSRQAQPSFHGKVTTARRINTSNSERLVRRDEVFLGGLETRVPRIAVPKEFVAHDAIGDTPAERVHRFDSDTRIVFYFDGSFGVAPVGGGLPDARVELSDEPHYLIGGEDVTLHVSGVVNGKVLVYAPHDIVIADDLLYAAHPRFDPDADDFAGLVADRNVVIGTRRLTGPGDVTVHAAIYAKGRFVVQHFGSGGMDTLHVYGSLAAGSIEPTEPRFRTRVEFDPRLEDARPPGFPVTERYEVVEWDAEWTEELPADAG